ncbi:RNA-guided endonuclease TnpB family protein, partial [Trichormus azollae HNT15244]
IPQYRKFLNIENSSISKIPQYKDNIKGRNLLPYPHELISKKALKKLICFLSMSNIKITTSQKEIIEARIFPKSKGIKVIITEEYYTSQASALDGDALPKYGDRKPELTGKRMARGLYKIGNSRLLNADINGSFNMMRKVIPDVFDQGIKGLPFNPVVLEPLRMTRLSNFE